MLIFKTRKSDFLHPIYFLSKVISSDGLGHGGDVTWTDSNIHELAAIWPLKAKERLEGLKLEHQVTHRVTIHYRTDIRPSMRIISSVDGTIFDIISIINAQYDDQELQILAREVTDE